MQVQIPKNNTIETPQLNTTANDTSDISANTNSANVDSTAKPMSTTNEQYHYNRASFNK